MRTIQTLKSICASAILCFYAVTSVAQTADNSKIFEANKRLGRGINLGNFMEVPRDANWNIPLTVDHLAVIKQAGFQSVRLPVKWSVYTDKKAPYTIEEDFAKRVDSFVDQAEKVGLNLVLNIHHFDGLDADPDAHVEQFAAIWKQLGKRYKDRGAFLYFELNNEPHDKLNDKWNEVLKVGLAAVRETNPTRPVIIGPPDWNGIRGLKKLELPADSNLIVTVHMYNPFEFTHQGASWATPEVKTIRDRKFGSEQEIAKVKAELQEASDWGKAHNVPIYLGEFGAFEMAPQESRVIWTNLIARTCESLNISWSYWEFGAGFGVYDLQSKSWKPELTAALLPDRK